LLIVIIVNRKIAFKCSVENIEANDDADVNIDREVDSDQYWY